MLDAIRQGCDNPHVEPIVLLCLATGARWSEAEGLTPARLRGGSVTYSKTKSSRVRTVPISPDLEALIRDPWKRYGPFTGAITSFRRALARSGIVLPKGQASHALRHTFASHFMQKGGNILTLQKILGHQLGDDYALCPPRSGAFGRSGEAQPAISCDTFGTLAYRRKQKPLKISRIIRGLCLWAGVV